LHRAGALLAGLVMLRPAAACREKRPDFGPFFATPPCRLADSVAVDVSRSLSDQYGRKVRERSDCLTGLD